MSDFKNDYIDYRVNKCKEALADALLLISDEKMECGNKQTLLFMFLFSFCLTAKA